MGSFLVWLVLCAAVVAGLTAVVVVLVARRIGPDVGGSGRACRISLLSIVAIRSISYRSARPAM